MRWTGQTIFLTRRWHIREFKKAGYAFIGVSDLWLYIACMAEKAVLIVFDDGYADNYDYAYPILMD